MLRLVIDDLTCVHSPQHTGDEFVDAIALLHKWHQGCDSALIVCAASKMGKYELLKRVNLVLKSHEVGDCLVAAEVSTYFM